MIDYVEIMRFENLRKSRQRFRRKEKTYCDLNLCPSFVYISRQISAHTQFSVSPNGYSLEHIKAAENNFAPIFADYASEYVNYILRHKRRESYALICPPARRHIEENFAWQVSRRVAADCKIEYLDGFLRAVKRDRFACPELVKPLPTDKQIIIYDDIVSSGLTIRKVIEVLGVEKIVAVICSINNRDKKLYLKMAVEKCIFLKYNYRRRWKIPNRF